jgi:hypothetical protein
VAKKTRLQASTALWALPPPKNEARALVDLAKRSKRESVRSLRALIAVNAKEKEELRNWALNRPELARRIEAVLVFRREVLREFERLLNERHSKN